MKNILRFHYNLYHYTIILDSELSKILLFNPNYTISRFYTTLDTNYTNYTNYAMYIHTEVRTYFSTFNFLKQHALLKILLVLYYFHYFFCIVILLEKRRNTSLGW